MTCYFAIMSAMKLRRRPVFCLLVYLCLLPTSMSIANGSPKDAPQAPQAQYRTALTLWRASHNQFAGWDLNGASIINDHTIQLDPVSALRGVDPYKPGAYKGHNFYNGGPFQVGEATSSITISAFPFTEAIASWNAAMPAGTWLETQIRARIGARWTAWYSLGVWASDNLTVQRHSVDGQRDADGTVSTDTLVLGSPANAFQLKARLFSDTGAHLPVVSSASVTLSTTPLSPATLVAGNPALWNKRINVPECSQMVYRDGGEAWCSPTSVSMLLAYWSADGSLCEPRVRATVSGVYDWVYDGHGNWPFNTAYAATQGYESYVTRLTSLAEAEPWVAAGVPVVISLGWGRGELSGAPIPLSDGHLALLVGFDASGNPIVNDPASSTDADVQRTYNRAELERLWLQHSGGTVYVIYPQGWPYGHYPPHNHFM